MLLLRKMGFPGNFATVLSYSPAGRRQVLNSASHERNRQTWRRLSVVPPRIVHMWEGGYKPLSPARTGRRTDPRPRRTWPQLRAAVPTLGPAMPTRALPAGNPNGDQAGGTRPRRRSTSIASRSLRGRTEVTRCTFGDYHRKGASLRSQPHKPGRTGPWSELTKRA